MVKIDVCWFVAKRPVHEARTIRIGCDRKKKTRTIMKFIPHTKAPATANDGAREAPKSTVNRANSA